MALEKAREVIFFCPLMFKHGLKLGWTNEQNNSREGEFMSDEKLKSCPFCGGAPELIPRGNDFCKKKSAEVSCRNCNVVMVVGAIRYSLNWAIGTVIDSWNRRTP